ncbi:MAG: mannose-1-phosphate guanylyltransferase/mannose-6-phosphate isomerase [Thermodesulfobacteriota bacterium]
MTRQAQGKRNPGLHVVILAGGSGTRFWPLSREQMPKQFLRILGDRSMLAMTLERALALVPEERVWAVTTRAQAREVRRELEAAGASRVRVLEEPAGRNTAAAIGLAALAILDDDPRGVMAIFPADHHIREVGAFTRLVERARLVADEGWLVTLGIKPSRPETGYGYILKGGPLSLESGGGNGLEAFKVVCFVEKPDKEAAERYLLSGEHLWNSGVFVWGAGSYLEELGIHLPRHRQGLEEVRRLGRDPVTADRASVVYEAMEAISVDYGVLERSQKVAVLPADIGWSDVGSWTALMEIHPKDANGNLLCGDVLALDTHESLVRSEGRLVATLGVRDLVVVETDDAVLVCRTDRSQEVRRIADGLRREAREEALRRRHLNKPWGAYKVLDSGDGYKVKWLDVLPGKRLSLQRHQHRTEDWVVASGTALVTVDGQILEVRQGGHIRIPVGSAHRVENRGPGMLRLIEIQTGGCLREDDVVRLQDDYGREDE